MSRSTVAPPDAYSPHTGDARIHVVSTELEIACKLGGNRLDGTARLKVKARVELERFELDLVGLTVTRVSVGGKKVGFKHRDGKLSVPVPGRLKAGDKVEVEIRYGGSPGPRLGPWGDVGWEELEDGVLVAGQPDGASTWFPCNDTPADKGRFSLSVSTDAGYRAVSNGTLVKHRRTASRETWDYEQKAPMPAYLATLQIGRYKRHEQPAGDVTAVPLAVIVADPQRRRAEAAFADQPRMMACFEAAYGPYPFEAYSSLVTEDALEIPLEAQGLSVFGDNHLSGAWEAQRLIAHELSHQWFGNSLTVRTWRDMWLHEGFACFSEWLWSEASGGWHLETRARHAWRGLALAAKDLVIGDPGPQDMFDDRVYKRGALAVYALRVALGDEAFTAALHAWTAEHRHGTVSRQEFEAHMSRFAAPTVDVGAVLAPWLDQADLPAFPG